MDSLEPQRHFNLLRWFSGLSFISILIVSSLSAHFFSQFLSNKILEQDTFVMEQFVQSVAASERSEDLFEQEAPLSKTGFEALYRRVTHMPEVVRANIYDRQGTVLWSDDARLIGHNFMPNPEISIALTGKASFASGTSGKPTKGEHVMDRAVPFFSETYIPLWNGDKSEVIGVFEVYKESMILFQAIQQGNFLIRMGAFFSGLFLYLSLYWIVKRATVVMHQQQAQLLESETLSIVGEMATAVAHGIRNPLGSIRSSAELALETDSHAFFRDTAEDIISEVDRLAKWIKELLSYARFSSGEMTPLQFNEFLQSIFVSFEKEMKADNIKVNLDLESALPEIDADEAPLRQMFMSLIQNAIDAMPDGGQITAKSRFIEKEQRVDITVADTGIGMSKAQLGKVFKPFFTTKRKGCGVGLALAKRIINRHHGTIRVDSKQGRGTTIFLQIHLAK
ncbi:MAG: nitrogen regulation protein NR(II) [Nitrospiria bacterium]